MEVPSPLPIILGPSNPWTPAHAHSYRFLKNVVHHTERATIKNAEYCCYYTVGVSSCSYQHGNEELRYDSD